MLIAGGGLIALFILFPGLVPDIFTGAMASIKETGFVQSIMSLVGAG